MPTIQIQTPAYAHIAFNNYWLPSAVQIEWTENLSKRPLYGVLSKYWRDTTDGRLQINGTLGVYHDQLNNFSRILAASAMREDINAVGADVLEAASQNVRAFLNARSAQESLVLLNDLTQLGYIDSQDIQYKSNAFRYTVQALNNVFLGPEEEDATQRFTDPLNVSENRRFTLDVLYGSPNEVALTTNTDGRQSQPKVSETLQDVVLTGRTKGFGNGPRQGSQPIMEFFTFVARRVQ